MANVTEQYVDPAVSRAKFDRELANYISIEADYRARGWFLVKAHWPVAIVALASKKTSPPTIVPPSSSTTRTMTPSPLSSIGRPFLWKVPSEQGVANPPASHDPGPELPMPGPDGAKAQLNTAQDLMQAHSPEEIPFLCIPGVKEYHDHLAIPVTRGKFTGLLAKAAWFACWR